jgi:hypothetical protein
MFRSVQGLSDVLRRMRVQAEQTRARSVGYRAECLDRVLHEIDTTLGIVGNDRYDRKAIDFVGLMTRWVEGCLDG